MANIVNDLKALRTKLPANAYWNVANGKLVATINGKTYEFDFERGDPITEALLLFLNNHNHILSVLETR